MIATHLCCSLSQQQVKSRTEANCCWGVVREVRARKERRTVSTAPRVVRHDYVIDYPSAWKVIVQEK